jgi:hypothetical protein
MYQVSVAEKKYYQFKDMSFRKNSQLEIHGIEQEDVAKLLNSATDAIIADLRIFQ